MFSPRPQASTPTSQGRFVFRAGPAMSCEASGPNQAGMGSLGVGEKLFDLLLRFPASLGQDGEVEAGMLQSWS